MIDLRGAIDMHIHFATDNESRYRNGLDLARQSIAAGMSAILLKSHVTASVNSAKNIEQSVDDLQVFGGMTLNASSGGLNLENVENVLSAGAKEIWMPTNSAASRLIKKGILGEGITICDGSGAILPVVFDILNLIAEYDVVLGTGHLSTTEIRSLIFAARTAGVKRILVTHPESTIVAMPLNVQLELSGSDVFFERCWLSTLIRPKHIAVPLELIAASIRQIGYESTILATDLGQKENPTPVDGMRDFIVGLMGLGISQHEVNRMVRQNPVWLLNLEDGQV